MRGRRLQLARPHHSRNPSSEAVSALKQIFHPLVMRGVPVLVTNYETAELAREATTAFVATKISFINEIASLCEHVNADAVSLSLALGLDKKIAPRCLQPGAGMGGIFAETKWNRSPVWRERTTST
jgi:UDPglucose 6-dehydrogenase